MVNKQNQQVDKCIFGQKQNQKIEENHVAAELAELALVNQVDQLTHQVDDVTTDQLLTILPNQNPGSADM